ncbi:MAG: DUF3604 domain-containing protein [Alphaproteobacteria bacterium]|nr:DUF3604 domain-containing protein [Alphaproteobacteria bacterium]MBU2085806.1 DUF3604 domain-containing protein [Alphaproteobacteria bacterium]MBU2142320.1 DUF3604 domain-containing protein [Alphaproteobacteria bacterium]
MSRLTGWALPALALAACAPNSQITANPEPAVAPAEVSAPAANPTRNAYFGDVHVHTSNSFDAYIFGVRATPDDAYRFAKGEAIRHPAGYDIKLAGPPLDFLAVTDHGEYLGVVPAMDTPSSPLSQTAIAQSVFGEDASDPGRSFLRVGTTVVTGEAIAEIYDRDLIDSVWAATIDSAERNNQPGKFTAFSGYEFTAMMAVPGKGSQAAANLHRNVIFRGEAPARLFSTLDSTNPEDLWAWMETQRADGRDVLAIPHNSNASNGQMFALQTYKGEPMTAGYATTRMRNEPLVEVSQVKGTSETAPSLSPNDEWADFEQYEFFIGSTIKSTPSAGDFVRPAYKRGLALQETEGFNPFKFGLISSSDTHVAGASLVEEFHWGKTPQDGASPEARRSVPPNGAETWEGADDPSTRRQITATQFSSSGLAGVWAEANTREAIFDAMQRKETFGTSGPRMKVRFFAGMDYSADMLESAALLDQAYAGGIPMGGQMDKVSSQTGPGFLVWAMRDPLSAPLQRAQVVKVWSDGGETHEAIHDVACSGGALPDATTHRCPDNGASVDISDCSTAPGTGASELKAYWQDPDFKADLEAAYYVRVLENPTCRWSTWDAVRAGTPPNPELPETLQERAWSSPIWYAGYSGE